jgi:FAD synthase
MLTVRGDDALPREGIYVCRAHVGGKTYDAVVRIARPARASGVCIIETDLVSFDGDVYGQTMTLDMLERQPSRVRNEAIDALIAQRQHRHSDERVTRLDSALVR